MFKFFHLVLFDDNDYPMRIVNEMNTNVIQRNIHNNTINMTIPAQAGKRKTVPSDGSQDPSLPHL